MEDNLINNNLIVQILNTYISFYNQTNNKSNNLFEGINYKDDKSTNNQLEELSEIISEYKDCKEHLPERIKKIKNITNFDKYDKLYSLEINSKVNYYCQNLFVLLKDISINNFENWEIKTIK